MGNSFMEGGSRWTEEDDKKWDDMTAHLDKELDSEVIDARLPYSKQAKTVKQALEEAFGEYAGDIKIVNRFFLRLRDFMDDIQRFQQFSGNKEGQEYEDIVNKVRMSGNDIKGILIDYGMPARRRMREDIAKEGKEKPEIDKILKSRSDKFLSLLRERIQPE